MNRHLLAYPSRRRPPFGYSANGLAISSIAINVVGRGRDGAAGPLDENAWARKRIVSAIIRPPRCRIQPDGTVGLMSGFG